MDGLKHDVDGVKWGGGERERVRMNVTLRRKKKLPLSSCDDGHHDNDDDH